MSQRNESHDQYTQRANLLSLATDMMVDWTNSPLSGIVVTENTALTGSYTLSNVASGSLDAEVRPITGITTTQAGPCIFSFSAKSGTLKHVRCRLLDGTLNKQLIDAGTSYYLGEDGQWRRYYVRGYIPTAGNVIYPYFRVGRGVTGDLGTIHVFSPVLEYGDQPNGSRLPDTTAQPDQDEAVMFYLRSENNSLQTHRRRKGDLARPLTVRLQDRAGNAVDLTSNTVVFRMVTESGDTVEINNRSCTINSPATDGEVSLTFQSGDVDTVGRYCGQFIRTVGGATEAFPPDKSFVIELLPVL